MTIRFNEHSTINDGGVLLEVDREPIADGNTPDGYVRRYFALPCAHGSWVQVAHNADGYDQYACANHCGARIKIRLA